MNENKCRVCGKPFDWRDRSDKKTCSDRCRKRYSKRKQYLERAILRSAEDILYIINLMDDENSDVAKRAKAALAKINEESGQALRDV